MGTASGTTTSTSAVGVPETATLPSAVLATVTPPLVKGSNSSKRQPSFAV